MLFTQRRAALLVAGAGAGAVAEQAGRRLGMAAAYRVVERGSPSLVLNVGIGALQQQIFHLRGVSPSGCGNQGGLRPALAERVPRACKSAAHALPQFLA